MRWFKDIYLEGKEISLVEMTENHNNGLLKAASDGNLWEIWHTSVPSENTIDDYIETALTQKAEGSGYPFVVIHKASKSIIGSTRFCNADPSNKRLEIGYTWYSKSRQRTGVNTESKFLMLRHAFENLDCIVVQFLTNWHNHASRTAISRLGAKQDGILRNHRLNADGSYRDTVVFSITSQEWSNVKKSLEYEMSKNRL